MFAWIDIKKMDVFFKLLGVCLLSGYLSFADESGANLKHYLYNYYLRDVPLNGDLWISGFFWMLLLLSAVLLLFSVALPWALLGCGLGVWYLKSYSIFAQCSWGTAMPSVLVLLAVSEYFRSRNRIEFSSVPLLLLKSLEVFVSLVYFASVTQRLLDPSWLNGSIVQQLLESRTFSRFSPIAWSNFGFFLQLGTYYTLLVELFGVAIPFLNFKYKRLVIIFLVPVHILLALVSTELVWQTFFISLLYLFYSQNPAREPFFRRQSAALRLGVVVMLMFLYTSALPFIKNFFYFDEGVRASRNSIAKIGLLPFTEFRLFNAKPPVASCYFIYAKTHSGVEVLKGTSLESCIGGEIYLFQDNMLHAAVRSYLDQTSYWLSKGHLDSETFREGFAARSADISKRWGYSTCKAYSNRNPTEVLVMIVNVFSDRSRFFIYPQFLSRFQCRDNQALEAANVSPELLAAARKDAAAVREFATRLRSERFTNEM